MALSPVITGLLAGAVTIAATPAMIGVARRADVMDHPGPLKPHAAPVPYLGGVAVAIGGAVALTVSPHPAVLLPLAAALLLGVLDDISSLAVRLRFAAECAVGVAVAWSVGLGVSVLGVAVLIGAVVMINAVNFVDGLDGLASGVCAVSLIGGALIAPAGWSQLSAGLAGAAAGFLLFNRPPARIYLGDAGSYLLGTGLALSAAAYLSSDPIRDRGVLPAGTSDGLLGTGILSTAVVVVFAVLAYPVVELVSTIARRLASRRPLFAGDRDHFYDRLIQRGVGGPATAALIVASQAVAVALGVVLDSVPTVALGIVIAGTLVAITVLAGVPRRAGRH